MKKVIVSLTIGLGLFLMATFVLAVDDLDLRKAMLTSNLWQQQTYNTQIILLQERLVKLKGEEEQLRSEVQKLTASAKLEAEKRAKKDSTKKETKKNKAGGK